MARVVAVFDDLLLGTNVLGWLKAGGHEVALAGPASVPMVADVLVVDLGSDGFDGVEVMNRWRAPKTLGIYSHVHHDVKLRAEAAGFDLVVPRSRMAREGAALVDRLVSPG